MPPGRPEASWMAYMLPAVLTFLLGVSGLAFYLLLRIRRRASDVEQRRVFNALVLPNVAGESFDRNQSATLPGPAARYLNRAIAKGTPLSRMVDLDLVGRVRSGPDDDWLSFEARERVRAGYGFLWQARMESIGRLRVEGADYFLDGEGRSEYFLAEIFPTVKGRGTDVTRSAAGHLLIESIWLPASLLPTKGARWQAEDNRRTVVRFAGHPDSSALNLTVADDGALEEVSMMRHQLGKSGHAGLASFGYRIEEEACFGGYTIPGRITASWHMGTDDAFEFLEMRVENALYY
jgi:hypothetical protein